MSIRQTLTYCSTGAILTLLATVYPTELKTSQKGLELIAEYEACVSCTYKDQVGVTTVGIGSTRDINGKPFKIGSKLSNDTIAQLFIRDVKSSEKCVQEHFNGNAMPQSVFDSTVSLVYNTGCYGARYNTKAKRPTAIARYATSGDWSSVCYRLSDFRYAGGVVNKGLENRRAKEQTHCVKDLL